MLYIVVSKLNLKINAQELRRNGYSLGEICDELHISKSTASLWCSGIILSKKQATSLAKRAQIKNYKGALLGALTNKRKSESIKYSESIKAQEFIGNLSKREINLIGTALYWAEGHKTGTTFGVVNSDSLVILLVMKWLEDQFHTTKSDYCPRLFINTIYKNREGDIKRYWSKQTGIPLIQFRKTIFLESKLKKFFNTSKTYTGVMHLRTKASSKTLYRTLAQIECIKSQILKNT